MNLQSAWSEFTSACARNNVKNALLSRDLEVVARTRFDEDCLRNAYSATKSFTATAAILAMEEGCFSEEDLVVDLFPEELPEAVSPFLARLRVRHLLSMTLGQEKPCLMGESRPVMREKDWVRYALAQPFVHEPGTVFQYTNAGPYLIGILVARKTGLSLSDYLYETILEPMGFLYPSWEKDPLRNDFGAGGLMVTTRHLLALGELYLQDGVYDGKRLLPRGVSRRVGAPYLPVSAEEQKNGAFGYNYFFWMDRRGSYAARGKYGQYALVMPEKRAVLAVTADTVKEEKKPLMELFWENVYPAL